MREISILTNQLTSNAAIESWFIQNEVLQGLSFNLEWDADKFSNQVVIYLEIGELNMPLIEKLKSNGNKVVLCQMGDELMLKYNQQAYIQCDVNLRNYYFPEISKDPKISEKTHWIPNGYKSGVGPRNRLNLRRAEKRHFLSSFLGWLSNAASYGNERSVFSEVAAKCPQDILLQPTASFAQGFNTGLYSAVLEHSVFCLCPAGNSPETIRLYDALENGCIPVSLKHAFIQSNAAMGNPPFPRLDDWNELPDFLRRQREIMASNSSTLVNQQQACIAWWDIYKKRMKNSLNELFYDLRMQ